MSVTSCLSAARDQGAAQKKAGMDEGIKLDIPNMLLIETMA